MPAVVEDISGEYGAVEESAIGNCEIMWALRSGVAGLAAHKRAGMDALSVVRRAILSKIDRFLWELYCE
jgi:hypothetical protein